MTYEVNDNEKVGSLCTSLCRNILLIFSLLLVLVVFLYYNDDTTRQFKIQLSPSSRQIQPTPAQLDETHFYKFYPSLKGPHAKHNNNHTRNSSSLPSILRQQAIGICINYNLDPDVNGHSLKSILTYYSLIHQYLVILTPSPLDKLSPMNQKILKQFNVRQTSIVQEPNNHLLLQQMNTTLQHLNKTNLYHIECANTTRGYYQYKCISLCAQFGDKLKQSNILSTLHGVLYLADDVFFNFTQVFANPERYSLDEFWIPSSINYVNVTSGKLGPRELRNFWWHYQNGWQRFCDMFNKHLPKEYRNVFKILYGPDNVLTTSYADVVYIPFADNQLRMFVKVVSLVMSLYPEVFCEIIITTLVDLSGSLCNHWPYQNDRAIYNSSVNLLNNITNIKRTYYSPDPYNTNKYKYRPCLLNPDGYIWNAYRRASNSFKIALTTGIFPSYHYSLLENESWPEPTEFRHPLKLSDPNSWKSKLWNNAMETQIFKFHLLQTNKLNRTEYHEF
ncbi:unnamed protein product [Didymodactylos carnosus]|uniref:Uncharacterized protein n=1 Tax=Didymodactylos carnosus TaxID=1234261 RepID=A0A815EJ36_9BILA|nr:unnamed protein product [Didymodactylos carnosus]CAF4157762.1 unnamed protein product [Didymodactylos carnosus]